MRKGLISFGKTTTATRCGNCPHRRTSRRWSNGTDYTCAIYRTEMILSGRHAACVDSERAFDDAVREAKAAALRDFAERIDEDGGPYYGGHLREQLGAEIKRLESEVG